MGEILEVNGKPAIRMLAKEITRTNAGGILLDCEGDEHWFPLSTIEIEDDETVLVQEWKYNQTFGG